MAITHRDIVKARLAGDMKRLTEASLGRIWQHIQKAGGEDKPLGFISAFAFGPDEGGKKANMAATDKLYSDLRSMKLGPAKLIGYWKGCKDKPNLSWDECPKEDRITTREVTFAVPGISRKDLIRLGSKFLQNSVIIVENGRVELIELRKGNATVDLGKFTPMKIADAYSRVKGHPFVFEGFDLPAMCWMDAILERAMMKNVASLALLF